MKKIVVFLLIIVLTAGLFSGVASALNAGEYATVVNTNGLGLTIRSGPSLSFSKIGNNPEGARVKIIDGPRYANNYTWWKIESSRGTGWSAGYYLASSPIIILPEIPDINIGIGNAGNGEGSRDPGPDQAAFYMDHNFEGRFVILNVGEYSNPDRIGLPNDNISSVKLGSNVHVSLYEHDNFEGRGESFTGNEYDLVDNYVGNDTVSSLKVVSNTPTPVVTPSVNRNIDFDSLGQATDDEVVKNIRESSSTEIYNGVTYIDGRPLGKFEELCNKDSSRAGKYLQQIICNNYTRVFTPEGMVTQMAISFVGLDLGADAVNLYYDATHAEWKLRWFGQTFIDGISILPVAGGITTLAKKAARNDWWISASEKKLAEESLDEYLRGVTKLENLADLSAFETKSGFATGFGILNPSMLPGFQAHHSLPQYYGDWLARNGINVHQLKYGRGVSPWVHNEITRRWTAFELFFGKTPPVELIQKFADFIDGKYGAYYHVEEFAVKKISKVDSGLVIGGGEEWGGGSITTTIIPGNANNSLSVEERREMIIQSYKNVFWCPPDETQIAGWMANPHWDTIEILEREHRIWITNHTISGFNESQARADFINLFKELLNFYPDQIAIEWNVLQMKIGSLTLADIRARIIAGMPK